MAIPISWFISWSYYLQVEEHMNKYLQLFVGGSCLIYVICVCWK